MKSRTSVIGLLLTLTVISTNAAELFVSPNGGHIAPFNDWLTAATNIQSAIDEATNGDVVTVTNGIYAEGGKVKAADLTNRIAIDKPILVRSVNGPNVTIIQGAWDLNSTNGPGAVRCAWLTNGATLSGFTVRGGATRAGNALATGITTNSGGGVWSASRESLVTNCIITGNVAQYCGGGVFSNTVANSIVSENVLFLTFTGTPAGGGAYESVLKNSAVLRNRIFARNSQGGGAYRGVVTNCTVSGNYAATGGGVYGGSVVNSVIWGNTAPIANAATNHSGPISMRYSCSFPVPFGGNNIAVDPQLLADGFHLSATSPCRGAGTNLGNGLDIDSQAWSNPPSMGCDEWSPQPLVLSQLKLVPGPQAQLQISCLGAAGHEPITYFWLRDGGVLSGANYVGFGTTRLVISKLGPLDAGSYQIVASNAFGMATSAVANVTVRCVNVSGTAPAAPYADWSSAATNIQTAIDFSASGDIVLVTNGVYGFGGKVMAGDLTNRIAIDKAMIVMSVNGATFTTIEGTPGLGGVNSSMAPNNTNAVRCAWLGDGAVLSGFTLRGGGTRASSTGDLGSGGGAWCAPQGALLSYCNLLENSAYYRGGGAYHGTLNNCTISGNGAGMAFAFQFITGQGGGVYNCTLNNCLVRGNQAGGIGSEAGAGAYGGTLNNCTVIQNQCAGNLPAGGAGTFGSQVRNCIVRNNTAFAFGGAADIDGGSAWYSCYGTYIPGSGSSVSNITKDPLFLSDGFHLSSSSPCLYAGSSVFSSGTDIDGQTWTSPPSMGCDQWLPGPLLLDFKIQASHWNQFDFKTLIAGIESSPGFWLKDGVVLSESEHHVGAATTALVVKGISASDGGNYQLIVSNSFGMTTSRVAEVKVHFARAGNSGAAAPFTNWATAAANIQDAIDAAAQDAVIVVTNGVYNSGGKSFVPWGTGTNRITLDKPLVVASVNGPFQTIIEGQWDPISTNGALAVRCALLTTNSSLAGFTLQNGAAEANAGAGGGIGAYSDELVSSCVISNNRAYIGGGASFGRYNNCWFVSNFATLSGGGFNGAQGLNHCTVVGNSAGSGSGGGNARAVTNSIIWFNSAPSTPNTPGSFVNSCSPGIGLISGNITNDPQLVDGLHLAVTSPCRGAGANMLADATDLDGDAWLMPPSMGADEFNAAELVGPLSVNIESPTSTLINRTLTLIGHITGRAARVEWNFGDGVGLTNGSYIASHAWTNAGDYLVAFTAFNADNPGGATGSVMIHVDPVLAPTLSQPGFSNNSNFQFQFGGQSGANYRVEYATNLSPPITWFPIKNLTSTGGVEQIVDSKATNAARFYRVHAQ